MVRQWAQSKPSEYQQNQREGGELESHLQENALSNVNKCSYQGVYVEKKEKTIYNQSQNTKIYFVW